MDGFAGIPAGADAGVASDASKAPHGWLEAGAVGRALQALAAQIEPRRLADAVLRMALETTGAQRVLLLLPHAGELRVAASAQAAASASLAVPPGAPASSVHLPHQVGRALASMLEAAAGAGTRAHRVAAPTPVQRVVLDAAVCLPLQHAGRLLGILYLEGSGLQAAGTEPLALLEVVAAPAALAAADERKAWTDQGEAATLRTLMEANIIGIVTWHIDGRILAANDEFLRIVGYAQEDLVGAGVRWTDLIPADAGAQDAQALQEVQQVGALQAYEREMVRRDGTRVPVLVGAAISPGAQEGVGFAVDLSERKRAEQALREMQREARLIMDTIPGLVATLTAQGAVETVNGELMAYCGQGLERMKEWGTNGTVHPEDMATVAQTFMAAIQSGEPYVFETRIRRFDGVYRWCQVRGLPLRDSSGSILRWYVLLTDCDDRRRAENEVLARERDLKLIVDTIPALAWSALPDGSADFFNQHFLEFTGLAAAEAAGWGWIASIHADDQQQLARIWSDVLASGQPGEAEARLRRHDGEYRWFLFRAHPFRNEAGTITKWYGANTDIEDRKRAEAELRRAYNSFRDAQRLSKTGSFITDLTRDDHSWSEETYRIFGFEPGSTISVQRLLEVIHPEDGPGFVQLLARGVSGVDVHFSFRVVPAPGAVKHVRGVAHVVEQVTGRPMLVGAMQDVTETVQAEDALNRARSELAHVARVTSLSLLTASITHEVSQPLSGVVTNANTAGRMLNASPPNVEGAREALRRILRDGNRGAEVIARLRAMFSKKDMTLEPMDLNAAAREVVALSMAEIRRNRVILQQEFAEPLPLVLGDRIQLQQVILNLLRNGCEAMGGIEHRPRTLVIRTLAHGPGMVRLAVSDAGPGLSPQVLEKLFDPFFTTKAGGMGIGLSVSRFIIERHLGRLWAECNEDGGASFSFCIPVSETSDAMGGEGHL
ncbi:MAG TPA: PAS domain S-box protein [Ramlibacter sp.]|jgi:PAS domain S-box-containing protein|nr:PAS domain S-box protein [Ramlibacter sp.]